MAEPHFIDSTEISPFELTTYKEYATAESLGNTLYYEWNERDQQWAKLSERDPDPPTDLARGRFDGQIIEVPRTT